MNARRPGQLPRVDIPTSSDTGLNGAKYRVAPESLVLIAILVLGTASGLVGVMLSEWGGTLLLFAGAAAIGRWYSGQ